MAAAGSESATENSQQGKTQFRDVSADYCRGIIGNPVRVSPVMSGSAGSEQFVSVLESFFCGKLSGCELVAFRGLTRDCLGC